MRQSILLLLLTLLALAGLRLVASGHGTPPPPPPPPPLPPPPGWEPDWGGPGDKVGNPTTPTAPGGLPAAPGTGGTGTRPGGPNRPTTGPQTYGSMPALDRTSWTWWWAFNKEPFLKLHPGSSDSYSGDDGFFLGHGRRLTGKRGDLRPDVAEIKEDILPALRAALQTKGPKDMTTACLVSLARIGNDLPMAERYEIDGFLRPFLQDSNQEISEAATAALGVLGNEQSAMLLAAILLDQEVGRRALDERKVPTRSRAFAAYALGLLGNRSAREDVRRFAVHNLVRALDEDETASADLSVACAMALGRVPLAWGTVPLEASFTNGPSPTTSRRGQIRYLLEIVSDKKADRLLRAHAVTSVSSLLVATGAPEDEELAVEASQTLMGLLERRARAPREVQASCAIALGMIGRGTEDARDVAIREALLESASSSSDVATKYFSLISLGRVATLEVNPRAKSPCPAQTYLLEQIARADVEKKCWSALALGILERSRIEGYGKASTSSVQAMHTTLDQTKSPAEAAAFSLGSGILGDLAATEPMLGQLEKVRVDSGLGLVALGLGILGAREAVDPLRALLAKSTSRPLILRETSLSLGLLEDYELTGVLVEHLRTSRSLAARSSIVQALGYLGDREAVDPLLAMLANTEDPDGVRALAAIALGLVCDRDVLPWNSIYSVNTNYVNTPVTLFDVGTIGILNML